MKVFDVHTHFTIETSAISEDADRLGFAVENKSIEDHVGAMERLGITYSLLTCPTQKYMDDKEKCVEYCRQVNDVGAKIMEMYPDKFGFAATLPLPFVDEAIVELKRAVGLGAKAVGLCSNYNGLYMGNEVLEPLFDVMDELKMVGIFHPAAPLEYPKGPISGKILPMYEFITDTTRTLLDMFAAEVLNRHPNVKIVVPHSGSCLPIAFDRFHGIMRTFGKQVDVPLNQIYFDLACDSFPRGVPILLTLTDADHIVYGTDYPAIPEFVLKMHKNSAVTCPQLEGKVEDVMWNNACELFGIK